MQVDNPNINSILHNLLVEHNRVSIPGMGSFMACYRPASFSSDSKLLPPSKEVAFDSKEIWNDERLERELAKEADCSLAEAREQVAFWIDDLCFRLATEKQVMLDGLGILTITDGGQIGFTLDKDINLLKNAYGLEPIAVKRTSFSNPATKKAESKTRKKRSYAWLIFLLLLAGLATYVIVFYNR